MVVEGRLNAGWQRGRDAWGARGLFPCSCMKELHLSGLSRRLQAAQAAQASELPPHALGMARALMSLHAQMDEELDFREGDLITIVGLPEPGWFLGELDGRSGTFPEGFVELLAPLRTLDDPHDMTQVEDEGQYEYYQVHREEDEEEDEECQIARQGEREQEQEEEEKEEQGGLEEEEEEGGVYGVALYDFRALETGELDFDVGDRIRVVNTLEDGWLEGVLHGRRGIFPHRFIKMEDEGRALLLPEPPGETTEIEVLDKHTDQNALQQSGDSWEPQEDHTVWDLDYFERREEESSKWMENSTCTTTTSSSSTNTTTTTTTRERAGSQTTTTTSTSPSQQTQAGEKPPRTRPPPPAFGPNRGAHQAVQRTSSGSPTPHRPQLPPRPSQQALSQSRQNSLNHSGASSTPHSGSHPGPSSRGSRLGGFLSRAPSSWSGHHSHSSHHHHHHNHHHHTTAGTKQHSVKSPFSRGSFAFSSSGHPRGKPKKLVRHASASEADRRTQSERWNMWSQSQSQSQSHQPQFEPQSQYPPQSQGRSSNGLLPSLQTIDLLTASPADLEAKLSQQLLEFESSLPGSTGGESGTGAGGEEDLGDPWNSQVSRHFSIMDFSSESDILRGSSHLPLDRLLLPQGPSSSSSSPSGSAYSSLERRGKTLRPPPPRPRLQRPPAPPVSNGGRLGPPPAPFRPARPAPRPPPPIPSNAATHPPAPPPNLLFNPEEEEHQAEDEGPTEEPALLAFDEAMQRQQEEEDEQEALKLERELHQQEQQEEEEEREREQYRLLLRLQEVERDIEAFSHTAHELSAMLEEEEDDDARLQAMENLEFCNYTVETLTLEQQQLQGKQTHS